MRLREIAGRCATAVLAMPDPGIDEAFRTSPVGDDGERLAADDGRVPVALGPNGFADIRIVGAGGRTAPPAAGTGGIP